MLVAKCIFANLWTLLYEVYLQTLCSGINYILQEEQAIVLPELPFKILSRENFYDSHLLPFFFQSGNNQMKVQKQSSGGVL